MAATGRHFPGHGAVALDSHLTLPVDDRSLEQIRKQDLVPFRRLIDAGLEAVMPAHVVYPQIDAFPAGFSGIWLQDILRRELGFNGVIFSDDLTMEGAAVAGAYPDRARLALEAGCDMLLVCNNSTAAEQVLDCVPTARNAKREQRLQQMRGKSDYDLTSLQQTPRWQALAEQFQQLSEHYA